MKILSFSQRETVFYLVLAILGSLSATILQMPLQSAEASNPTSSYTTAWNVTLIHGLTMTYGNGNGTFQTAIGPSGWQTASCISNDTSVTLNQPNLAKIATDSECSLQSGSTHPTVTQVVENWSVSTWTPAVAYRVQNNARPNVQEWDIPRFIFDAEQGSCTTTNCISTYRIGEYGAFAPGNNHGDPNNYTWSSEFPLTWQVKGYVDQTTL